MSWTVSLDSSEMQPPKSHTQTRGLTMRNAKSVVTSTHIEALRVAGV